MKYVYRTPECEMLPYLCGGSILVMSDLTTGESTGEDATVGSEYFPW